MTKRRRKVKRKRGWRGYSVEECGKLVTKTYPTLKEARKAAKKAPEAVIRSKETGHFVNKEEGRPAETPEVTRAKECPVEPPKPKRFRNEKAKDEVGGLIGYATTVLTTAAGCLDKEPARYRLTSVARLCPSHDGITFKVNACYPKGTQERRYGKDRAEQQKVIGNAQASCFEPAAVANTDPTPLGGPPIVTKTGLVLGGNSRAMVLQRIYQDPKSPAAKEYRRYLSRHAPCWGFDEADVATTELPVLVRVVDKVKGTQKNAVRRYNEALTQELGVTEAQVATSARIDSAIIAELENMGEEETLSAFLQSQRSAGLVRLLRAKNVITRQQVNKYIGKNGLLNEDGRRFFSRALVGKVLPDADELDLLTPSIRESLARAVPYFLRAGEVGEKWDIRSALPDAVRLYSAVRASKRPLPIYLNQRGLFDAGVRVTTATVLLAQILLDRSGPVQMSAGARRYAASARGTMTIDLFGEQTTPIDALAAAFSLKTLSGPHIEARKTFRIGKQEPLAPLAPPKAKKAPEKRTEKPTAVTAGSPEHKAKMARIHAANEAAVSDIKETASRRCYLPEEWREDSEWGLYYVDLHSNNHEYDRRECIASKKPLRWVVTGVSRVGDGLLHALYWFGTKAEAEKKDRELRRNEYGKRWPYEGAGPHHFNLKVRKVQHAKSGDARTETKKVSAAKEPAAKPAGITKELAKSLGLEPKPKRKETPKPSAENDADLPTLYPYATGSWQQKPDVDVPDFLWLDRKHGQAVLFTRKKGRKKWEPWKSYVSGEYYWEETPDWRKDDTRQWSMMEIEPLDDKFFRAPADLEADRPRWKRQARAWLDKPNKRRDWIRPKYPKLTPDVHLKTVRVEKALTKKPKEPPPKKARWELVDLTPGKKGGVFRARRNKDSKIMRISRKEAAELVQSKPTESPVDTKWLAVWWIPKEYVKDREAHRQFNALWDWGRGYMGGGWIGEKAGPKWPAPPVYRVTYKDNGDTRTEETSSTKPVRWAVVGSLASQGKRKVLEWYPRQKEAQDDVFKYFTKPGAAGRKWHRITVNAVEKK